MSDQEIKVQITADVANMLKGMQQAKESVETAASGMRGNLGDMAESFEKLGASALALGAVGIAAESLKEAFNWVVETAHQVNEMSRSFEGLRMETGATLQELGAYDATMKITGGTVQELGGWLTGVTRAMKANADVFIANGVAADKASLMLMKPIDVMRESLEVIESATGQNKKNTLATEMLGRAGLAALPQMTRFFESMGDGKKVFEEYGKAITDNSIHAMQQFEKESGILDEKIETQKKELASGTTSWALFGKQLETWGLNSVKGFNWINDGLYKMKDGLAEIVGKANEAANAMNGLRPANTAPGSVSGVESKDRSAAPEPKRPEPKTKGQLEEEKAAAKERERLAKEAAAEEERIWKEQSAQAVATYEWELQYLKKAAKEKADAAKEEAREEMAAAKDAFTMKEEMNSHDLAMGRITAAQKLAAEREFVDQKEMLEIHALAQEQLNDVTNLAKWKQLEDKKLDITRKAELERQKLLNQGELQDQQKWKGMLDKMTTGWDQGIQKMLHGQMSFSEGFRGAMLQMEDQFEKSVINMGLQWAKGMALQLITGEEAHASENLITAKSAAGHAYDAVVGIPVVGPVLAPAAAAVAFTGVMAFAEGGWDRVPAAQVAMLHKDEMVLPAWAAEGARRVFGAAGDEAGGGDTHLHAHFNINAVDASGFSALINRSSSRSAIIGMLGEAMRNGRKS